MIIEHSLKSYLVLLRDFTAHEKTLSFLIER